MKRMLFNATQAEELRVAIVDGQKLIDLDIETVGKEQRKSNIYKGIITRIEPSLEACFVDYGCDRHGFLPFKEIARAYLGEGEGGRGRVADSLKEGQQLIVQVEKDERGNKGAALTTYISLAGRYLVLMPNNPRGGGVSRRIEGEERNELRAAMDQLETPNGMSLIARTAAIGRNAEELQWDLGYLLQLWRAIEGAANTQTGAFLIYQESSLVIRAIRDYFQPDIGELLIDKRDIYEQAQQFMSHVMPNNVHKVKFYQDDVPLFSRFQIEHQIETAYSREVSLPSGGAIVLDRTEALWSIDVNSAKATRGGDIEETALRTNLEAADEIARQMRLRDVGGLIVIDFIDMENPKNQRDVENRVREALHHDRARVQTGKISRFGLMELSRQRLQPSLEETSHIACPRCHGTGFIRGIESSALHILRIIQEEAMKENTGALHAQVPVDVATFLLNEKRAELFAVEARLKVGVMLIPNMHLETPNYSITRVRSEDVLPFEDALPSYRMVEQPAEEGYKPGKSKEEQAKRQEAAVKGITPAQPAPASTERVAKPEAKADQPSLWKKIVAWFSSEPEEKKPVEEAKPAPRQPRGRNERRNGRFDRNENREGREGQATRERGERAERGERSEKAERPERTPRSSKPRIEEDIQKREERQQRPSRGERQPREERQRQEARSEQVQELPATAVALEVGAPEQAAAPEANGETRNRRRRSRRDRRDRNDRTPNSTETTSGNEESTPAFIPNEVIIAQAAALAAEAPATPTEVSSSEPVVVAEPVEVAPAPSVAVVQASEAATTNPQVVTTPVAEAPTAVIAVNDDVVAPSLPAAPAPIVEAAPVIEAAPVVESPVVATEVAATPAPVVATPKAEFVVATPAEVGLTQVATRNETVAPAAIEEVVVPARRRRSDLKNSAESNANNAPIALQLVETRSATVAEAEIAVTTPVRRRRKDVQTNTSLASSEGEKLAQVETKQ
ncbi:Rne/Rng family ribonuclease [Chitinibacter bivalviorum]|uniref:Ribonuclease E n=1 Tax=Chitinibacter bivalviorum TaxID=2739434 RepID=A0A7H9BMU4_9NEIS|nr:Rne/Rng family ribonuclease [Chitinibacter bivalviorum]QLG89762.1 Rne/Rng family ribonuclease [Chitinibacter bivalviorum]